MERWNLSVAGTCMVFSRNDQRQQRPEELADEYAKVSAMVRLLAQSAAIAK